MGDSRAFEDQKKRFHPGHDQQSLLPHDGGPGLAVFALGTLSLNCPIGEGRPRFDLYDNGRAR